MFSDMLCSESENGSQNRFDDPLSMVWKLIPPAEILKASLWLTVTVHHEKQGADLTMHCQTSIDVSMWIPGASKDKQAEATVDAAGVVFKVGTKSTRRG
ncbi:hypothetical protein KF913_16555 [Candidatus Obscuribacterales bacterium]|nr:hypothetical protein [Candidatus Obscuribacterales bacterium]